MRRLCVFLLTLLLVAGMLPMLGKEVSATSVTQSQAVAWARDKIGVGLDYDGAYGNQCVDLIYYYYNYLGVAPVGGNACDYENNTLPAGWTRISTNIVPQPGDIAVWHSYIQASDGSYITEWAGHIGIVTSGNASTFSMVHQNYAGNTTCGEKSGISVSWLKCIIRPNFWGSSSEVNLSWSEYPDKHWAGLTNAVLAGRCDMNIDNGAVSEVGITLYDYQGNPLASKREGVSFGGYSYFTLWYDVNAELGYTLKEGTPYQYKFSAVVNGTTYYSSVYDFTTVGTHTHSYNSGTVTKKPTCTATGIKTFTCSTCGGTKAESIAVTGHNYNNATCTTAKTCKTCGATSGSALGHNYDNGSVTTVPTCTSSGVRTYVCSTCGAKKTESIAAAGHNWQNATCNAPKICSKCGATDDGSGTHNVVGEICTTCQRYGTCGENLTWILDDEWTLTILGTGGMTDWSDPTYVPWVDYRSFIKKIVIESGVTEIGSFAFRNCTELSSISIPDSVVSMSTLAFNKCNKLCNIWIDSKNNYYSSDSHGVLFNKDMTKLLLLPDGFSGSYTIPASVISISDIAFNGCANLTSITIPNWMSSIPMEMFDGCTGLTRITIPSCVTSIGIYAFDKCDNLQNVVYCGTSEQWSQIKISSYNTNLTNAHRTYHERKTTVTKEPTYTAAGEQVSTCIYCGEEKVETIPAKFYGTSVNLGNTLDMYFGFYTGLVDENGTVQFVREFTDGTTETTTAPITSFNKNNSVYDITYTGLAAKEMCDTIHVYVYNGDGELVGQHSDSIRSYILRQLREKDYGQEFRTLCIDLLNYGAAAQETFGYNTSDLANKDLTAEELAEGTQTVADYADKLTVSGTTAAYYGTAYLLETRISMSTAVRGSYLGDGCYALVSYTDHTGTAKENIRLEGMKNNSVYEFFLDEIVVADGRCLLTIEFYKADGTKVLTVQDSMESYTARNAQTYPLAEKMLAFSDSAYNYLHRNDN